MSIRDLLTAWLDDAIAASTNLTQVHWSTPLRQGLPALAASIEAALAPTTQVSPETAAGGSASGAPTPAVPTPLMAADGGGTPTAEGSDQTKPADGGTPADGLGTGPGAYQIPEEPEVTQASAGGGASPELPAPGAGGSPNDAATVAADSPTL